ncbi:hypothetical protein ACOMHN_005696 [Nucella lapillus]
MADDLEEHFEQACSGASETYPKQCSALRKNEFVMIKGHPCKIVDMSTSKTGKHGHAKVHIVAIDIFTGKKYEDMCPSTHNTECPNVAREDFSVLEVDGDGFLTLMDENSAETRSDLRLPDDEELASEIKKRIENEETFMVTVLKACNTEMVVALKKIDSNK